MRKNGILCFPEPGTSLFGTAFLTWSDASDLTKAATVEVSVDEAEGWLWSAVASVLRTRMKSSLARASYQLRFFKFSHYWKPHNAAIPALQQLIQYQLTRFTKQEAGPADYGAVLQQCLTYYRLIAEVLRFKNETQEPPYERDTIAVLEAALEHWPATGRTLTATDEKNLEENNSWGMHSAFN
jgi:hypothetical protein